MLDVHSRYRTSNLRNCHEQFGVGAVLPESEESLPRGLTGTSGDRGGIEGELDSSPSAETRWDRVVPRLIPVHMRGPRRE